MGQAPFFSVIVPTYNRPRQLTLCLRALALLDYPRDRFEVILVDDGGTTTLDDVALPFQSHLDLALVRQERVGPAAARNSGAKRSKGRFLVFTDDDCMPRPDWLKKLARRFGEIRNHMVGGQTLNGLPNNPYSAASQLIVDIVYSYYNSNPLRTRFFASNNLSLPADLFAAVGGFDETFRTSEDRDLCDRWLYYGYRMTYAPEAVVYHAHSLTLSSFCSQHFHYGRGAFRFHQKRLLRASVSFKPELGFYLNFLRQLFFKQPYRRLSPILLLWQLANTAGFLCEMARYKTKVNRIPA